MNQRRNRRRCSISWCRYDALENEFFLFLDSTAIIPTIINSYCIVVPYLQLDAESTESAEFTFENGKPCFHLPFFFGIMNTQVRKNVC